MGICRIFYTKSDFLQVQMKFSPEWIKWHATKQDFINLRRLKSCQVSFPTTQYETKRSLQEENWKNRIVLGTNLYYCHKESIRTMQIHIFT